MLTTYIYMLIYTYIYIIKYYIIIYLYISIVVLCFNSSMSLIKDNDHICWNRDDVQEFWTHWENHSPAPHPATSEKVHLPIGISGDDAKYTLAGSKIIVIMLSFLLQRVYSVLC